MSARYTARELRAMLKFAEHSSSETIVVEQVQSPSGLGYLRLTRECPSEFRKQMVVSPNGALRPPGEVLHHG